MSDRPIFDATDPDMFFRLQMVALKARKTLMLNTGAEGDFGLGDAEPEAVTPSEMAQIFADVPAEHTALMFHTSGSTGEPKPVPHSWGHLVGDAHAIADSVGLSADDDLTTVLTVPLDHMFGFSYGFMLTNLLGFRRPTERVVAPKSLLTALEAAETPVVLITTPTHLRLYSESIIEEFPNVARIFCATSPIPDGLGEAVLSKFGVPITDIYGCTEAGTLAYRVMDEPNSPWTCLKGVALRQDGEDFVFETDYFDEPVVISDRLEISGPDTFRYLGRSSDLIKIGGKRQSLDGMARMVEAMPQVKEAKFFLPPDEPNARLVLLVVFEGPEDFDAVRATLKAKVDPVFRPRHMFAVDALPRNANGKLPISSLMAVFKDRLAASRQLETEGA